MLDNSVTEKGYWLCGNCEKQYIFFYNEDFIRKSAKLHTQKEKMHTYIHRR